MNRTHWTVTLGDLSSGYLRAINHKFALWEMVKLTAEEEEDGEGEGVVNPVEGEAKKKKYLHFGQITAVLPPANLFTG